MVPFEPFRIPIHLPLFLGQFKGARLFKLQKLITAFRVKKGDICFEGAYTIKKLVPGFPSCHSPHLKKKPHKSLIYII